MCSDHVKCTLFRSFCTSLYTCQLWCNYKSESIRKLYVAYNNVFRLLCNEPRYCTASYMFVTRGLPTCKMLIRKKVYSFMMCIAKSSNTILQSILNSDAVYRPTSQMYQHWRSVLYLYHFLFKHLLLLWKVCYHWMNVLYNDFESNVWMQYSGIKTLNIMPFLTERICRQR